ncbi:hypothetical protein TNCV_4522191 [Trichonephila clavipes]|nr:hypothetical protein TNCV_4522191 [Trichonephila clavipes]
MNSSQHRCMNQVPASENQTQQRSLNSSLEVTVGSPLVHLGGMLLNGSTSSLPNSPLQPSVTSITCGPCQMNSLAASVKLAYSASMVDRLTDFCLKVRDEIGVSSIKVMNPPIDTRSSLFVAKPESE